MPVAAEVSVIVPIFREPAQQLKSLKGWIDRQNDKRLEWVLVVADDRSTGSAFAEAFGSPQAPAGRAGETETGPVASLAGPEVKTLYSAVGRSSQMNTGARSCSGALLVFMHADSRLSDGWIDELCRNCEPSPGPEQVRSGNQPSEDGFWGAFTPKIDSSAILFRLAELWGGWRSRVIGVPYGDQTLVVSRSLFEESGGYDEAVQFMEDVDLAWRLRRSYCSPTILDSRSHTSARAWRTRELSLLLAAQSGTSLLSSCFYRAFLEEQS